ncbi:uncharacterized protein LOC131668816 isoform X2 [Phymastichus coffea]|uniref:uncharacterized protein LOC131668816 isoform X2 n=1 Tax=Phymastichus coffea TaxID=108790 RepID=UPI00273AE0F1|nr:uncharacterized protein LOC131668816 isoform X2 [Phymastichus coffea]
MKFLDGLSIGLHILYTLEVNPADYSCNHQKQIKGNPTTVFEFATSSHALEKFMPWLTRFKEADNRPVSIRKSYTGWMILPILGEIRFHAKLLDYRPGKLFDLEFSDDLLRQRIIIQTRSYHDRTLLQTTIHFRRNSLLYHCTIGYILRVYMKYQLEKSMKNLTVTVESLGDSNKIPNFSRKHL